MDKIVNDFFIFLATVDPVSTLAIFVALTAKVSPQERTRVALRCVVLSALILLGFVVVGQILLDALGVRLVSFRLAGGLIFFLFGIQMVFGSGAAASTEPPEPDHDIAVFPLAVPSIASPGSILAAVVLTDNDLYSLSQQAVTTGLLLVVLALTLVILLAANPIYRVIGKGGANLLARVLGLVLAALATEMVLGAVLQLAREIHAGG
jgi:multiple antibiotic resistance protein